MEWKPLEPNKFAQITLSDMGGGFREGVYTFCYPNQVCIARRPNRPSHNKQRWSFLDDGSVLIYSYEGSRLTDEIEGQIIERHSPLVEQLRRFIAEQQLDGIINEDA
jgi:hypothetical protein